MKQADLKSNIDSVYSQILKDSILVTGWYYIIDTDNGFKRQLDKSLEFYFIDPKPIVVKDNFIHTEIYKTDFKGSYPDYTGLTIRLDKIGTDSWAIATEKAISKRLALIINNKLVNAPKVNSQITVGVTALNRSEYNEREIEEFKKQIDKN
jgi:preprotein translocase subunit SecD